MKNRVSATEVAETPEERKDRLKRKLKALRNQRSNGSAEMHLYFDDDEVTDAMDMALTELEDTAEACERDTNERVRTISERTMAVQDAAKKLG